MNGSPAPSTADLLPDQSARAPEALTIFAHLAVSAFMKAPNSSGVMTSGYAPWLARFRFTSSSPTMRITSAFNLLTMSRGTPAGLTSPNHSDDPYPGKPASSIVGRSGKPGSGALDNTARPR